MLQTAFKFLLYDKAKALGALLGVIISTFLIGQQAGVFLFLTDTMKELATLAPGYLWVVDNQTQNVNELGRLDMRVGYEIKSLPGVEQAHPLLIGGAAAQIPNGDNSGVLLIGLEPPVFAGAPHFVEGRPRDLLPEGAISVDVFDTRAFPNNRLGATLEINGRKTYIAARSRGVRGFGSVFVFTTIERARALTGASPQEANAFLVRSRPGQESEVIRLINENIYGVRAWRGEDFADSTVSIILRTTSIAFSVGTLVLFAFVAGLFIVGLTLYSSAIDRIRDYGTMKAIGANNHYIRRLIFTQALVFAVAGFSIGFLFLQGFRRGVAQQGLLFEFSPALLAGFIFSIAVIALGGAILAVRRIGKLEPAAVFRQ